MAQYQVVTLELDDGRTIKGIIPPSVKDGDDVRVVGVIINSSIQNVESFEWVGE